MLTYERLDEILGQLTQKEAFLMRHPDAQMDYSALPKEEVGGLAVYRFSRGLRRGGEDQLYRGFTINVHERFSLVPMHVHDYIEMSYVYRGQFPQMIGKEKITLNEGQIILLDTNAPHAVLMTGAGDIIVNFSISTDYFAEHFISRLSQGNILGDFYVNAINEQKSHDRYIVFPSEHDRRIRLFFKELLCEYFNPSVCHDDITEELLTLILSELLVVYEASLSSSVQTAGNRLLPILRYMDTHYADCTLEGTASFFGLHPNYLTAVLKKRTGKSFKELLLEKRLSVAAGLILATGDPVTDIASHVGYQNMSFFYRKFQEKYGQTPAEYRKTHGR